MYFSSKNKKVQRGSICIESFHILIFFLAFPQVPRGAEEGGEGVNPSGGAFQGFEPCDRGTLETSLSLCR